MVVLDQVDRRTLAGAVQRLGERPVHGSVVVPDLPRARVPGRQVRQIEQVVVELPEHVIRHAVVVPRVPLGRDVDERHAPRGLDRDGLAVRGDLAVAVAHRAGEPGGVALEQHAGQRRDEAAGAALRLEHAGVVTMERDRTTVRCDDERRLECRRGSGWVRAVDLRPGHRSGGRPVLAMRRRRRIVRGARPGDGTVRTRRHRLRLLPPRGADASGSCLGARSTLGSAHAPRDRSTPSGPPVRVSAAYRATAPGSSPGAPSSGLPRCTRKESYDSPAASISGPAGTEAGHWRRKDPVPVQNRWLPTCLDLASHDLPCRSQPVAAAIRGVMPRGARAQTRVSITGRRG